MENKVLNRVPQIIFLYWIIKIAATTLGETGADMFSMTFSLGYSSTIFIFGALFVLFLLMKLKQGRYSPTLYWLTFTASAIAGTAISDYLDRTLGMGYLLGSALLIMLLIMTLTTWYFTEKTLSVERITTNSAEGFYWLAFLIANTLGTAFGDYLADDLALGFLNSAMFIGLLLLTTLLLHYYSKVSGVLLFWIAFVFTRPFGATFGDYLTKNQDQGGIGLGTVGASLIFALLLIVALYAEITRNRTVYVT